MEHVYHIPEQKEKETSIFYTTLVNNMKVLVATEKPFAKVAVDGIREVIEQVMNLFCLRNTPVNNNCSKR